MNRKALLQRKADLTREGNGIVAAAESENRGLTAEDRARLGDIEAELVQIDGDLVLVDQQASRARQMEALRTIKPEEPVTATAAPVQGATGWSSFGEMLIAAHTAAATPGRAADQRLQWQAAAAGQSQGIPAEGGFLVDPTYSNLIWDGLNEDPDNLISRTDTYPVTGESLTFKANAETSRATGSRYGAARAYWLAEADTITASKVKFREVKLEPQQLAVLIPVTDKLLRNAPALEAYVTRVATAEIMFMVNDAIINGTGVGQPLGILNGDGLVSVTKETGQTAATFVAENVSKMWARLHPRSKANAVWLVNTEVNPQLDALQIAVGTSGQLVYMNNLGPAPQMMLKGRPVIETEFSAALGTVGDVILCDLKAYATGTRGGVQSAMSMHFYFDTAQTAFRFMFEIDGQPWVNSAITPFKGSSTLSPFVALATRS